MLCIRLMGNPSVTLDGQAVTFPFKRAEALLYYLVVRRSATRQELISMLWESSDETVGLKNLRNALYTLKKCLGGEFLLSPQKSLITVNPEWSIDCDYDQFVSEHNFSAYHGAFLQGFWVKNAFSYEEWLARTREKLHDQYLRHMARQVHSNLEHGNQTQAIQWATDYLREDPLDEEMCCVLMRCYQSGQQYAKAVSLYQRLKQQLSDELGADPLESTTLLYYEILNTWNDSAQFTQKQTDPLPVGREDVYRTLRAAIRSFEEGAVRNCSHLLAGEVGSGKSELINYFVQNNDLTGFLTLRGICLMSEEQMPLCAWDTILMNLAEFVRQEGIALPLHVKAKIAQSFPTFDGLDQDTQMLPKVLRKHDSLLADSILVLLTAVKRRKKILLLIEDLQWMDSESLLLLDTLLRRMKSGGMMCILTSRTQCRRQIQDFHIHAQADGLFRRQELYPLTLEQTQGFLSAELGSDVAQQLGLQFYQETGGNLHLLTQLTGAYEKSCDVNQIIRSMSDILMDRLAGLSEAALDTARLISIFEEPIKTSMLLTLMGADDRKLTQGLKALLTRGLVEETQTETEAKYHFTHQRIRQLVYERLPSGELVPLHQQVAHLLAERTCAHDTIGLRRIARHFQLAGDLASAWDYQVRSLEEESSLCCEPFMKNLLPQAQRRDLDTIASLCKQALSAVSTLRQEKAGDLALARIERGVHLIQGRVALFQGRLSDGAALLGSLSGNTAQREDDLMIKACYLLALSALNTQNADLAERYITTGSRLLERGGNQIMQAQFHRLRGSYFCLKAEYEKSVYYLMEATDLLERMPDQATCAYQLGAVYFDYGKVCRQQKNYAKALQYFKRSINILSEGEPVPGSVWPYVHYGRTAFALDDHVKARELFKKGYETAKATGELWGAAAAAAFHAYYHVSDDQTALGAQLLQEAQQIQARLGSPLEGAVLCFVSMSICEKIALYKDTSGPLHQLLPLPADSYARQGIRMLSGVPDVFEVEQLSKSLQAGISARQKYRASELYSKHKHFMTE